jgi:hypothetical protein
VEWESHFFAFIKKNKKIDFFLAPAFVKWFGFYDRLTFKFVVTDYMCDVMLGLGFRCKEEEREGGVAGFYNFFMSKEQGQMT